MKQGNMNLTFMEQFPLILNAVALKPKSNVQLRKSGSLYTWVSSVTVNNNRCREQTCPSSAENKKMQIDQLSLL